MMAKIVNICDVCSEIFAGGDAPKNNMSIVKTDKYNIPIYSNGEANDGLYGFTNFARVSEPSITISARGTIGYTSVRNTPFVPIVRLITLVPKKDIIDIRYLFYAAQNYKFDGSGTSIPQLTVPALKKYNFPLPTIEEQKRIVVVLDKICDIVKLRKQQLSKLDELVKARFVELFGDPVSNSKNLPELTLPELGEFGRGVSKHRPRNAPELLGGEYPLIQTGEVANSNLYITEYENTYSELGFKQSKLWQKGTLCITIAANIAKTAILTFDACFPDSVVGFKANDKTNNVFIHYWFSFFQKILESQAPESAQKNINLKVLSELKVIVPPIELQNKFANFVKQIDKSKFEVQQSLEKLETLKKSLMQQYFG
ncbi:MAG: restriction endonuclease subunit S [Clostridia bacterium]|nr:restriction endonuclease subunit S [Clostridia bacterium]